MARTARRHVLPLPLPQLAYAELYDRPFDELHHCGSITSRILRLPLSPSRRSITHAETRRREDHLPGDVDEYLLFSPFEHQGRIDREGSGW